MVSFDLHIIREELDCRYSLLSILALQAQIVENGSHVCGGTLLTRNWIITTSFCIRQVKIDFDRCKMQYKAAQAINITLSELAISIKQK